MAFIKSKVANSGTKIKIGTGTYNGANSVVIDIGFKVKYFALSSGNTTNKMVNIYNADVSTTKYLRGDGNTQPNWYDIGDGQRYTIVSITSTKVYVSGYSGVNAPFSYFAIG